jgi:hypothetical protein
MLNTERCGKPSDSDCRRRLQVPGTIRIRNRSEHAVTLHSAAAREEARVVESGTFAAVRPARRAAQEGGAFVKLSPQTPDVPIIIARSCEERIENDPPPESPVETCCFDGSVPINSQLRTGAINSGETMDRQRFKNSSVHTRRHFVIMGVFDEREDRPPAAQNETPNDRGVR